MACKRDMWEFYGPITAESVQPASLTKVREDDTTDPQAEDDTTDPQAAESAQSAGQEDCKEQAAAPEPPAEPREPEATAAPALTETVVDLPGPTHPTVQAEPPALAEGLAEVTRIHKESRTAELHRREAALAALQVLDELGPADYVHRLMNDGWDIGDIFDHMKSLRSMRPSAAAAPAFSVF